MTPIELNIDEICDINNQRSEVCKTYQSAFLKADAGTEAEIEARERYEKARESYFTAAEALRQECTKYPVILEAMNWDSFCTAEEVRAKVEAKFPSAAELLKSQVIQ